MSLAGLHISDSFVYQRNTIALKKQERFAVMYIKVMFIQYFNITSDFRGRYLNTILYLHVKCQQQFIDIVLPFIIRVLIVFLIFV